MSGRNLAASIRDRLLNKARAEKLDYNLLLTRYALERMALAATVRKVVGTQLSRRVASAGFQSFNCRSLLSLALIWYSMTASRMERRSFESIR